MQRVEGSTVTEEELHVFVEGYKSEERRKFNSRNSNKFFFLCIDKLPDEFHKLNGGIYFVDSFSRTHTGKIKRLDVKNLALQLYTERVAAKQART